MCARSHSAFPRALSDARRQFDRWRRQHRPRSRLPKELWHEAVTLAQEHGLSPTARALGLGYGSLKQRVAKSSIAPAARTKAAPDFVELLPRLRPSGSVECTLEWADLHGSPVRLHIQGLDVADLVLLARGFREDRA